MALSDTIYTVPMAAAFLGLSERRVRQFCQSRRIGERVGNRWLIPREQLVRFKKQPRETGKRLECSRKPVSQ
jgi:excisionase family DNA binding protein